MKYLPAVLLSASLLCGCVTTPSGQSIVDPALTQSVAQDAALLTAQALDAKYHGELVLTYRALDAFVTAGSGDVVGLQAALSNLPVTALQGTNGAVLNQGGSIVINQAGQFLLKLDKNQIGKDYIMPIATGLRDGLRQALGANPQSRIDYRSEFLTAWK